MNRIFWLHSTAILVGMGAPLHAQEVDAAADPFADIVVTAQRREESIQDVPISIAVLNDATVAASGNTNITSLNGLVPNVVLQTQGLVANVPMIAIRGMSSADPDPNADPKVSTIIDGVYIPFVSSTMLDMFDIERVEILKGPQGVLFGKNNLAGTINVLTSRPTEEFGVDARGTIGSYGALQFRGRVNSGRIGDAIAAKLMVNIREYDGYSENVITGNRLNATSVRAVRGALNYDRGGPFDSLWTVGAFGGGVRPPQQPSQSVHQRPAGTGGSDG